MRKIYFKTSKYTQLKTYEHDHGKLNKSLKCYCFKYQHNLYLLSETFKQICNFYQNREFKIYL